MENENIEIAEEVKNEKKQKSIGREIFEWAYSIIIAVIIAFLIKHAVFR